MNVLFSLLIFALSSIMPGKKDAPGIIPPAGTPEELLTAKTWKMEELRVQQSNNVFVYYNRRGSGNTANYDADSLKFNPNGTGFYYSRGSVTKILWAFTNEDKTKMDLTIRYRNPLTITIENIVLSEKSFMFSQSFEYEGVRYTGYGLRTPTK